MKFTDLALSQEMLRAVTKMGFDEMTSVQAETIPPMLDGKDIIAKAPTGTGKTCAFGIPIIEHIDLEDEQVQALILCPTRELCVQIYEEMKKLALYKQGVRIACVYGGQQIDRQINALKKRPQIVVATPGRLKDHLNRHTIRLDGVRTAVLDEADRMLDMGFVREVTAILDKLPEKKQVALLSATISREVMDIGWMYQRDAVEVTVLEDEQNKPKIAQFSLNAVGSAKTEAMLRIIEQKQFDRVIVFCNTKHMVTRLTELLIKKGFDADQLHGDIRQNIREKVMAKFRSGQLSILVATDVAARGIDVDDVDAVFNYDIPSENEYYLHRIGRTGRAKRQGESYVFVSFVEALRLKDIMRYTKTPIIPMCFDKEHKLCPVEKADSAKV